MSEMVLFFAEDGKRIKTVPLQRPVIHVPPCIPNREIDRHQQERRKGEVQEKIHLEPDLLGEQALDGYDTQCRQQVIKEQQK